ncbi:DUF3795 domain-containing protein [Deltaproteobacteria bacterium OttesenSCG-928-K17]|nr:DUF3795 domain-containing protein [Deltaproteobacteria bacterium OttesenSCG-928-K17]
MDYFALTSPCGLDCFNCPLYLARTDEALRADLAGQLNNAPEVTRCEGCRNQDGRVPAIGRCTPCHIYQCASDRQHAFCGDCPDFPCDYLHPVADQADRRPHNTKVFNSCLIKKMGLAKWATEKAGKVKRTYFSGKINLSD